MSELPVAGSYRPTITAREAMVASGHDLASLAAQCILDQGGNTVDAGVAAGLCTCVLQVFLNVAVFGMLPQAAIEAPRFATYSYPGSFEPYACHPDELRIQRRLAGSVGGVLADRGHRVVAGPDWTWRAGGVCAIGIDRERGVLAAGAAPRRTCYAIGW